MQMQTPACLSLFSFIEVNDGLEPEVTVLTEHTNLKIQVVSQITKYHSMNLKKNNIKKNRWIRSQIQSDNQSNLFNTHLYQINVPHPLAH